MSYLDGQDNKWCFKYQNIYIFIHSTLRCISLKYQNRWIFILLIFPLNNLAHSMNSNIKPSVYDEWIKYSHICSCILACSGFYISILWQKLLVRKLAKTAGKLVCSLNNGFLQAFDCTSSLYDHFLRTQVKISIDLSLNLRSGDVSKCYKWSKH